MKIKVLPLFALCALVLISGQSFAEDRAAVLERIAPVGRVNLPEQAAPADAAPAEETTAAAEAAPPAAAPAEVSGPEALAKDSGCLVCHNVDTKVIGPAYKEVAAKYKGDDAALEMLVQKVKDGGVGTWGDMPMPANANVSEADIRTIVTWVLSL